MNTDEMRKEDAAMAVQWMTEKIRKTTQDTELSFPVDWVAETGLSVFDDEGKLLAVAILYLEKSSPVAVCGWCIANPSNTPAISHTAISLLMKAMPIYARKKGAKILLTLFGNRGINDILSRQGFLPGEFNETKLMIL